MPTLSKGDMVMAQSVCGQTDRLLVLGLEGPGQIRPSTHQQYIVITESARMLPYARPLYQPGGWLFHGRHRTPMGIGAQTDSPAVG